MFPVASRVLALVLLFVSIPLTAAEVWDGAPYSSDPAALLAAAEKIQSEKQEEGVIVLLDESIVRFEADGRATRVERLIFRVLDDSGVDGWATIQTGWAPWYHEKPQVDARVVTKSGAVHRLDPKSFGAADAEDEPDMFSDTRILSGPLPAVAPGSVVEQTITYRDKNPLGNTGLADRHTFGRWVETRQSRLVLEYPSTLELKLVNRSAPRIEPQRSETDGVTRLVFETGPRPAVEGSEWSLPSDVTTASMIAWTTGKSWQAVAQRYAEIVDEKIGDGSAVAKLTAAAVGNAKDKREIVKRVLAAIERDIRYAGVEFGEGSIFPRTPAETLKNKYGDCKDKATLLVAMLRHAGVPANTVLIRSGLGYDVEPDLPGLGHFNHVIVLTEGPDPIWIDPTDEFARAGELPDSDQGRLVLVAKRDTTALVRTPLEEAASNRTVEHREFWLAEDGKATVTETTEYFGSDERTNRRYYVSTDQKQVKENFENYAQQVYLSKKLSKWEKGDARDLSKPFRIHLEMKDATRGMTGGGEAAVGIFLSRLTGDLPPEFHRTDEQIREEEVKPRRHDFVFAKPYVLEMHYRIHPPIGYDVRTLPENETRKLGTATLTKQYKVLEDGTVLADFRMDSGPRRITAAQHEELRQAVVKLAEEKVFLLYFDQRGRKFLDEGEVGKAVAEYRRVAALHPKEGLHRAEVAAALLGGGLGAAARAEAKRAVELDPKSPRAHAALGAVLSNDLIGRPMRAGSDVAGAIAAYRKAKELAPDDLNIRAALAMTLEYSNDGVRYGDAARMDESIAECLAIKKEIEDADKAAIDRELMPLYAHRDKWAELKQLVAETTDTQQKDIFRLVAIGASEGGAAAVAAASSLELAKRRDTTAQAAGALMGLRYYPASADLFTAAAQGAPNAAQLRAQADLVRKTVRVEELKTDRNDPASLLKEVFGHLFNGMEEDEIDRRYSTAEVAELFAGEGLHDETEKSGNAGAARMLKRRDLQARLVADLAISAFNLQPETVENVGIRLRGRAPGGGNKSEFTAYLVRENGALRFAATDDAPYEFGLRALRHAEKNELAAARQWLDWAREHMSGGGGDDVLSSHPFTAVWTRGKEATADEIRLAAALLLPETKKSAELALPVLEAARPGATPEVQWRIDQSLGVVFYILERHEDSLAAADRLLAKFPDSSTAFTRATVALARLDRRDELEKRAKARLEKMPGDLTALRALGSNALHRGAYAEAVQYLGAALERANVMAGDYNEHAWASIFAKDSMEKALEHAQHAAGVEPDSYAILNTLAVIYAELGNSSEARETLLKSLEQHENDELQPSDWYVVGRIAENYGILDAAADAYRKVPKPERVPASTWELAQQRLAKLK